MASFTIASAAVAQKSAKHSKPSVALGHPIKTILTMVPWGSITDAVIRASKESQSGESRSVSLNHLEGVAKLIVAEAEVTNQVTKWQEATYGSITMKTDVVSRVTYSIDLSKVRTRMDKDRKAVVVTLPPVQVDSIEHTKWDTHVTFTRVRKFFSSDTRAALEATTRSAVKADARKEAEKYLFEVRAKYLEAIRKASEKKLADVSTEVRVVFE